jgi:nicotinamidase-related amidase
MAAGYASLDPSLSVALLLIDNQSGLEGNEDYWGGRPSTPNYKQNVKALLQAFRQARKTSGNVHIFHIGHSSTNPRSPLHRDHPDGGIAFFPFAQPEADEPVFWKTVNSAFVGTDLEKVLRDAGVKQLVIAGLTTDHCVSTTIRMGANIGVVGEEGRIILAEDATYAFPKGKYNAETVHGVSVETLRGEFAEIWKTLEVVEQLKRFSA